MADKWRPIADAPEYTYVLISAIAGTIYTLLPIAGILRYGINGYGWCDTRGAFIYPQPTHFRALPPPEVE